MPDVLVAAGEHAATDSHVAVGLPIDDGLEVGVLLG